MKTKLLKTCIALLILNYTYSQKKADCFSLECKMLNDYSGWIYLEYENKRDSCFIENNHFSFKGKLENEVSGAVLTLKNKRSTVPDLYLENSKIEIELEVKEEKRKDYILSILTIKSAKGTKTSRIQEDFTKFQKENNSDKEYMQKWCNKVDEIVTKYPKNPFGASLLCGLSWNKTLDQNKLKNIYSKVDKNSINKITKKVIEKNLFLEKHITVNDSIFDFNLLDRNNNEFDTKSIKGKWILIDFWASWCGPCRKQLPELKKIYEENPKNNFEIVGVSIDEEKTKWTKALDKEQLNWINVNENKGFYGKIALKYNVDSVPRNYLINPEGKIIAENIELNELEKIIKGL
ncbi:TlpA disulfide reductase family protein [Flavobacterium sp. KS-LB2]|uniref:TlpA disulfide reductase family protein n=1 Tax=Flavobacterium sp. KS-LB2 TaxID=3120525 RepID=UPI0030D1FC2C